MLLKNYHKTHLQGNGGQVCCSPNALEHEMWVIEQRGDKYVLRDHNNTYLCAEPNGTLHTAPHTKEWEHWSIVPHPTMPGRFAFRSYHNTYLRADANGVTANLAPHVAEWEAWEIRNV